MRTTSRVAQKLWILNRLERLASTTATMVARDPQRDAKKPGPERAALFKTGKPAMDNHKYLLHDVIQERRIHTHTSSAAPNEGKVLAVDVVEVINKGSGGNRCRLS